MQAAIYARKSTDQEDARSVSRQIEQARAFAQRHGWSVSDDHVFTDDAVSGAEFGDKRPALQRLLRVLKPAPFGVLIIADLSRLGREQIETSRTVKHILRAGVQLFSYLDDKEIRLDTPIDKMILSLGGFAAEDHRHRSQQRGREKRRAQIEKGHWPGGAVFGYRKRDVYAKGADGRDVRSHVVIEPHEAEACIVRDIYERYAQGQGYKTIAHDLNRLGVPAPRAQQGRRVGWDPGTVYAVLRRELYRGEIVDGKRSKRDEDGKRVFGRAVSKRPEESWLRVPAPHLRIVPLSLTARVDERLKQQKTGAKPIAHPGRARRYLLTGGLLRCHCGGAFEVVRGRYHCSTRRRKGPSACDQRQSFEVKKTDNFILDILLTDALDANLVEELTRFVRREAQEGDLRRRERDELARRVRNMETAMEDAEHADDVRLFMAKRRDAMRDLKRLDDALAAAPPTPPENELRDTILHRVGEWRKILMTRHLADCRAVVQRMVEYFVVVPPVAPGQVPEYLRQFIDPKRDLPLVEPKFAAFLDPAVFTDTFYLASPQGIVYLHAGLALTA